MNKSINGGLSHAIWELHVYDRYITLAGNSLAAELKALEDQMDADIDGMTEHDQDGYLGDINDHWIETALTLPRLQWASQFLLISGFFEKVLNDCCTNAKSEHNLELLLKNIYGQGLARAKVYLSKVAGISTPFTQQAWSKAMTLAEIRNVVAHRDGWVALTPLDAKSEYVRFLAFHGVTTNEELLAMSDDSAQIVLSEQFVRNALTIYSEVLDAISRAERSNAPNAKPGRRE